LDTSSASNETGHITGYKSGQFICSLHGRAQDVAASLRRAATRKQLGQSERKPVDKAADYIDNNQERLQYDQALAYGLPIATGIIEGGCRYLVKDRMDITGARWGLERAEVILKLRSLKVSGNLAAYLAFHFEQVTIQLLQLRYWGLPLEG